MPLVCGLFDREVELIFVAIKSGAWLLGTKLRHDAWAWHLAAIRVWLNVL